MSGMTAKSPGTEEKARAVTAILIAGPTASGKSALALALAERLSGTVVNADSMQIYRDLRVLTARPSAEEEARAPHRLYGHVDAAEPYSVARWLDEVRPVLSGLGEAGRVAIVAGGTGLYFKALTEGLSQVPEIDPQVRAHWRQKGAELTAEMLHRELAARDPVMAGRLRPSDTQRLVRALEVIEATGRSLAEWQGDRTPPLVEPSNALKLVLSPQRDWLHERIVRRFRQMAEKGGMEEAARLVARDLDPSLPAMKAIGLRELAAASAGDLDLEEAVERASIETRRYAKRQQTFYRGQFPDWPRADPSQGMDDMLTSSLVKLTH
ncbi:tRNA (adenosine(37)-N6)-dimethylallyltransferase MiaA [Stappia albiluteola]|uniref:tRNA (adenosine(37)-N6)-dimethylallyltransferase MiaA n=1 Tax=Stappia albiluteola TaxID=2758565 RepID=UPI0038B5C54B